MIDPRLFTDPAMFDSRETFRDAGFEVFDRSSTRTIMVGRHKSTKSYLFKKYSNSTPSQEQLKNYTCRMEGAQKVRAFIEERRLQRVVVPRKTLHELPTTFAAPHLLIVERLKILDDDDTRDEYEHIDEMVLRELCEVLRQFRGLDSWTKNLPFTRDGKIALIDTEKWERDRQGEPLRKVREHLDRKARRLVEKLFA